MRPAAALAKTTGALEADAPAELAPVRGIEVAELSPDRHCALSFADIERPAERVHHPGATADAASLRGGVNALQQVAVESDHHRRLAGIRLLRPASGAGYECLGDFLRIGRLCVRCAAARLLSDHIRH